MNLSNPLVHQIDTRQNPTLNVFDGSNYDESKLAKQFWNSVILMPPVESTLVCKEIKQRTKCRSLHCSIDQSKLTSSISKSNQERQMKNKEYEEIAALKDAEDEGKRIQTVRDRHEQVRQLFFKQARINRLKHQQWAIPPVNNYMLNGNQGTTIYYREQMSYECDNESEREQRLVRSLPD